MNQQEAKLLLKAHVKNAYHKALGVKTLHALVAVSSGIFLAILFFISAINFFSLAICALAMAFIMDRIFGVQIIPPAFSI